MPILLVDANNLVHRAAHVMPDLHTSNGLAIGGVFGFVRILRSILDKFPEYTPVIVWDSASMRRKILSLGHYKLNRLTTDPVKKLEQLTIRDNIRIAHEFSVAFGLINVHQARVEADDIIASIARASHTYEECIIHSTDKDFFQLLNLSNVKLDRSVDDFPLDNENFESVRHCTPLQYRAQHVITGDGGDGIRGIDGVGGTTAFRVAKKLDESLLYPFDIPGILDFCRRSSDSRTRKIWASADTFEINYYLIDLLECQLIDTKAKALISDQLCSAGSISYKTIAALFGKYEFVSFAEDFQSRLLYVMERVNRQACQVSI